MAKDRSFAAKIAKGTKDALKAKQCPKCGEIPNIIKVVQSEKNAATTTWRFRERYLSVCKCNEKEVYA